MHRLLPHHDPAAEPRRWPGLWIPTLLEHGDSSDLAWLFATFGGETVRRWVRERGGRQLSRRSRAFWSTVLEAPTTESDGTAEALWPH